MSLTMSPLEAAFTKTLFSTSTRLRLYYKMSTFLKEGVPLNDIVEQLLIQYTKLKKGDIRAKVLNEWRAGLAMGRPFSKVLADWAPPGEAMIIQSGERSGDLSSAFHNAIMITESSRNMKSALTNAMSYPTLLLLVLFGLIYMFSTQAVPTLASVLSPDKWPDVSKKLYYLSNFVANYWWAVLCAIATFCVFSSYSIPRLTGSIRRFLDYVPPWSLYKSFQSSVFLVSMAAMMATGTPLVDSIKALQEFSNRFINFHLKRMLLRMDAGRPVGEALNSGFFNKEMGVDIEVYGSVANIQDAMNQIGRSSIEDGIESITKIAGAMKNMIMIAVGCYVGWVYYAFYTLTSTIGKTVH